MIKGGKRKGRELKKLLGREKHGLSGTEEREAWGNSQVRKSNMGSSIKGPQTGAAMVRGGENNRPRSRSTHRRKGPLRNRKNEGGDHHAGKEEPGCSDRKGGTELFAGDPCGKGTKVSDV